MTYDANIEDRFSRPLSLQNQQSPERVPPYEGHAGGRIRLQMYSYYGHGYQILKKEKK